MKIQIEGDKKKIKQLIKELTPRCKRDKVGLEIIKDKIVKKQIKEDNKKIK